jgi:hypothetical protein
MGTGPGRGSDQVRWPRPAPGAGSKAGTRAEPWTWTWTISGTETGTGTGPYPALSRLRPGPDAPGRGHRTHSQPLVDARPRDLPVADADLPCIAPIDFPGQPPQRAGVRAPPAQAPRPAHRRPCRHPRVPAVQRASASTRPRPAFTSSPHPLFGHPRLGAIPIGPAKPPRLRSKGSWRKPRPNVLHSAVSSLRAAPQRTLPLMSFPTNSASRLHPAPRAPRRVDSLRRIPLIRLSRRHADPLRGCRRILAAGICGEALMGCRRDARGRSPRPSGRRSRPGNPTRDGPRARTGSADVARRLAGGSGSRIVTAHVQGRDRA